ncbi:hypothetical protein [uncultured Dokdonia sp.]|uniref:hypothetical protein n=1 Tax=uncultured Dokdonia sp. TaxID=575653 RepID=UPI0026306A0C|nr:hypothetical protein [uncultured Dokdonia sp.]
MRKVKTLFVGVYILLTYTIQAQVGINTTTPDPSSILDIVDDHKGILIPRVSLQGKNDVTTIRLQPDETRPATGLLVYNLSDAGTGDDRIATGFYYYNNDTWVRLHDEGFSLQYDQTEEIQASSNATTYIAIPGLDTGVLRLPYAGIYKVSGTGFYSPGAHTADNNGNGNGNGNSNGDGVGIASLALEMEVNGSSSIVKERFVSALSLDLGNNNRFDSVGQQVSYSFSFEASPDEEYRFIVKGREWNAVNTEEEGIFGKDTDGFTRSNGQNDAYRGSLIISLTRQF